MRAVVLRSYGPPEALALVDLPVPEPRAGQVRVRVVATTVSMGDTEIRSMSLPGLFAVPIRLWLGLFRPRSDTVLGMELAGVVDAVADDVSSLKVGDRVFGAPEMGFGTYAELVCVQASALLPVPEALDFATAATLPIAGLEAMGYLRRAGVDGPKRVLIRGASGSIGTFAVQLARRLGAHVTAVCGPGGVERVQGLGADAVLDYTRHDFDAGDARYDVMVDIVGKTPLRRCLAVLVDGGTLVRCTVPGLWEVLGALWTRITSRKRVRLGGGEGTRAELEALTGLVAAGEVESVIDRRYPLEAIVEAHRYVETGHKQGHVVLDVHGDTSP